MLTFIRLWAPPGVTPISRQENWYRDVMSFMKSLAWVSLMIYYT